MKKLFLMVLTILILLFMSSCYGSGNLQQNERFMYENNKYSYNFEYISDAFISYDSLNDTSISVMRQQPFAVRVIDTSVNKYSQELLDLLRLEFENFIDRIYQYNIDLVEGEIQETTLSGEKAYQMEIKPGKFNYPNEMEFLSSPTIFLFVKKNNLIYQIQFPKGNEESKKILESFRFN